MHCDAKIYGDTTQCATCGLTWDTNDVDPPACKRTGAPIYSERRIASVADHEQRRIDPAMRFDGGKRRVDLVPVDSYLALADVYDAGARKYAEWNWLKGMAWTRVLASMERHILALKAGEDIDADLTERLGRPVYHAAAVAWNAFTLTSYQLREIGEDDRRKELKESPRDKNPREESRREEVRVHGGEEERQAIAREEAEGLTSDEIECLCEDAYTNGVQEVADILGLRFEEVWREVEARRRAREGSVEIAVAVKNDATQAFEKIRQLFRRDRPSADEPAADSGRQAADAIFRQRPYVDCTGKRTVSVADFLGRAANASGNAREALRSARSLRREED